MSPKAPKAPKQLKLDAFLPVGVPYLGIKPVGVKWVVEMLFLNEAGELVVERLYGPTGRANALRMFRVAAALNILSKKWVKK